MGADDMFDTIVLVAVLAILTPIMLFVTSDMFRGNFGGFGVQIEKTALHTDATIIPVERKKTTEDVMLMLAVADQYEPLPLDFQLSVDNADGPTVRVDTNFLYSRAFGFQTAFAAMTSGGNVKYDLFVGNAGMRKWVITHE